MYGPGKPFKAEKHRAVSSVIQGPFNWDGVRQEGKVEGRNAAY